MTLPGLPEAIGPGTEDAKRYAQCMAELRQRLGIAKQRVSEIKYTGKEDIVNVEVIFIQLRKCLELVAFGSLIANREIYARTYKEFRRDGRAKKLVEHLKKLNSQYFPVAVAPPRRTGPDSFTLDYFEGPTLTEDELVKLYDIASKVLHIRNPFSDEDPVHDIGYSVNDWILRITNLLKWHYTTLVTGLRWLVEIPDEGHVHVYTGVPQTPPIQRPTPSPE